MPPGSVTFSTPVQKKLHSAISRGLSGLAASPVVAARARERASRAPPAAARRNRGGLGKSQTIVEIALRARRLLVCRVGSVVIDITFEWRKSTRRGGGEAAIGMERVSGIKGLLGSFDGWEPGVHPDARRRSRASIGRNKRRLSPGSRANP